MTKPKLTVEDKLEALINQVDDMDRETLLELAKAAERAWYQTLTDAEIEELYNDSGIEGDDGDAD